MLYLAHSVGCTVHLPLSFLTLVALVGVTNAREPLSIDV